MNIVNLGLNYSKCGLKGLLQMLYFGFGLH